MKFLIMQLLHVMILFYILLHFILKPRLLNQDQGLFSSMTASVFLKHFVILRPMFETGC